MAQSVDIEGLGFRPGHRQGLVFTSAWILDAQTREPVWTLGEAKLEKEGRRLVKFTHAARLKAGAYEVYYSSFPFHSYKFKRGFFDRFFAGIFEGEEEDVYHNYREEWEHFGITVTGRGKTSQVTELDKIRQPFLQNAFVAMYGLGDESYQQAAFELTRPMNIQIYALGELRNDGAFDYGWIMNTETRKRVWKLTLRDSEHAGGAEKNRRVRTNLYLPEGKYVAYYATDDSHSRDGWNDAPPFDPDFWGLTLRTEDDSMLRFVKKWQYGGRDDDRVILKMTGLRDNEFVSKNLKCKKDSNVRIYALGEGKRHEMYDYSWIINSKTHDKIWAMDYHNTEHAGGADRNRLYDGVIALKRGDYIVYCMTDDSHSSADWKDAPPYDRASWGITLSAADDKTRLSDFVVAESGQRNDETVIAKVTQVRNHAREGQSFKLTRGQNVRIYAIGEGEEGEMYDFGWIENAATKQVVWEMTYRRSRHAGGSKKNRLIDEIAWLEKGEYIIHFQTDGSHSFNRWNSDPPYDPLHWGITVYESDK